jgi:hypothetical protein
MLTVDIIGANDIEQIFARPNSIRHLSLKLSGTTINPAILSRHLRASMVHSLECGHVNKRHSLLPLLDIPSLTALSLSGGFTKKQVTPFYDKLRVDSKLLQLTIYGPGIHVNDIMKMLDGNHSLTHVALPTLGRSFHTSVSEDRRSSTAILSAGRLLHVNFNRMPYCKSAGEKNAVSSLHQALAPP